jgi:hypothetical protein
MRRRNLLVRVVCGRRVLAASYGLGHRSVHRTQQLPLGLFEPGLDVPLPNIINESFDGRIEPATQETPEP